MGLVFIIALWLLLAPWPLTSGALPHAVEKLSMLRAGALERPLDIFDLLMHTVPMCIWLGVMARRLWLKRLKPL